KAGATSAPGNGAGGAAKKAPSLGPSPEMLKAMQTDSYRKATFEAKYDANGKPIVRDADAGKDTASSKTVAVTLSPDEIKQIEKLPVPADRQLALAQKICLVSEDEDTKQPVHLGTMGMPFKTTIKGKTVFLCCDGCLSDLKKDPDKYLVKLPK